MSVSTALTNTAELVMTTQVFVMRVKMYLLLYQVEHVFVLVHNT